jgi:preprotein translocase subunit SecG
MLNLLAISYEAYKVLSLICLILSVLVSIFVIAVVIMQPGNSSGIGAINGQSETFYGKNKNKTLESKMKKLTVISIIILVVCLISFYILTLIKGV